jgi:hypothetical protein
LSHYATAQDITISKSFRRILADAFNIQTKERGWNPGRQSPHGIEFFGQLATQDGESILTRVPIGLDGLTVSSMAYSLVCVTSTHSLTMLIC